MNVKIVSVLICCAAGGDCNVDLEKTIMPVATAGGIYDFSEIQASHVFAEYGLNVTKEEVKKNGKILVGWEIRSMDERQRVQRGGKPRRQNQSFG